MKYYELLSKSNLVNQIPLVFNGIKLPADTAANIVLLKVSYNNAIEDLRKEQEEILKNLKKEGFDDRLHSIEEMESVDARIKAFNEWTEDLTDKEGNKVEKPTYPTEEEINKANETRKISIEFEKEKEELSEVYEKAIQKKYFEDVKLDKGITKEDWKNIYDIIGTDSTIEFKYPNGSSKEINGIHFLQYIGELIK